MTLNIKFSNIKLFYMPGHNDNNEKGISSRGSTGQGGAGSQDASQNKSNVNSETQGGNRPEPRSKASEQNADGENKRTASTEELARDKEMD